MKDDRRIRRVEKEIQHLVANFLLKGFKYPLRGFVSVTRVESNERLRTAKVFVSVMGTDEDKKETMATLEEHVRDIQLVVNDLLRMRFVPRITILLDEGMEKTLKIEAALREIELARLKNEPSTKE